LLRFSLEDVFEEAWSLYPKKRDKKDGKKAATKLVKSARDFAALKAACAAMGKAWRGQDLQYCRNFSTFVRSECWRPGSDEELPLPRSTGPKPEPGQANPRKERW